MRADVELFVVAEMMLVEVLGRIGADDWGIVLPPLFDRPGADRAASLLAVFERHVQEDSSIPAVLAGGPTGPGPAPTPGRPGVAAQAQLAGIAAAACAAARRVTDRDIVVPSSDGELPVRDYLRQLTVTRCLVAHYVAAYLGSTACPLPEELARPLWERTEPEAARWRSWGFFRSPLPLPEQVSWRDRFLLCAGHEPHPLGH